MDSPLQEAKTQTATFLTQTYPGVFPEGGAERPLAIGTSEALLSAHPNLDRDLLSVAIKAWVKHPAYMRAVAERRPRIALDGSEGEVPTQQHASFARLRMVRPKKGAWGARKAIRNESEELRRAEAIAASLPAGSNLEGDDLAFVSGLLDRHPDAAVKKAGMTAIQIMAMHDGCAFAVVKEDGSMDLFSLLKCLIPHQSKTAKTKVVG